MATTPPPSKQQTVSSEQQLAQLNAATQAAKQLGLELVRIDVSTPQPAALRVVSEKLAREHRLIPLTLDDSSKRLTIAVADPSLLAKPAPAFLQGLKQQGYALTLVITPGSDFETALAAYGRQVSSKQLAVSSDSTSSQPSASAEAGSTPPPKDSPVPASVHSQAVPSVSLRGRQIPATTLERFPQDVARKYQMVVFEVSTDGKTASVAAVNPNDRRVREILKFVQERNGITLQLYQAKAEELKAALEQYPKPAPQKPVVAQTTKTLDERRKTVGSNQPSSHVAIQPSGHPQTTTPHPPVKPAAVPAPDLQRATVDKLKAVAQQPSPPTPPPAPPAPITKTPPTPPLPPTPNLGAPVQPQAKIGGLNPVSSASSYQQAVTRNSAPAGPPKSVLEIQSTDLQAGSQTTVEQPVLEINVEERNLDTLLGGTITDPKQLEQTIKTGMVPQIIAASLSLAVSMRASDIHLEASREYVRIRFRIDGTLQEIIRIPTQLLAPLVSRLKILAKLKIDESRIPQDGRFDVAVAGHEIDLRMSTLPTVFGEKVVLRILDKSTGLRKLEELGLKDTNLTRVRAAIGDPYGIILVTGPTGSGKTSTLYAMLSELNTPEVNIVTLEDPVEYQLEGINQTQVKPAIGFSFANGLRSILRQDPNIVMVGEIRDKETAGLATQAALTGHLVLSTLHTNDASGAIPRMLDMGVEPFLLASSLKAIIGQRLVRKCDPKLAQPVQVPAETLGRLKDELAASKAPEVVAAAGQPLAFVAPPDPSNYSGRLGIYEVLSMSPALAELTLQKAAASKIAQTAIAEGMVTMRQDGILKALTGQTSLDEILQATAEAE